MTYWINIAIIYWLSVRVTLYYLLACWTVPNSCRGRVFVDSNTRQGMLVP